MLRWREFSADTMILAIVDFRKHLSDAIKRANITAWDS
jgi:hypothetical protein